VVHTTAHSRKRLCLKVADRGSPRFGEPAHAVLSQPQVIDYTGRERLHGALDVRSPQAERRGAECVIAPAPDCVEDRSDALGQIAKLVVVEIGGRCTTHDYVVNSNHTRYRLPRQERQDR
jgi:hypothetical protein